MRRRDEKKTETTTRKRLQHHAWFIVIPRGYCPVRHVSLCALCVIVVYATVDVGDVKLSKRWQDLYNARRTPAKKATQNITARPVIVIATHTTCWRDAKKGPTTTTRVLT